jgi:hypothetical protein
MTGHPQAYPRLSPELAEQLARVPKSSDGYVEYAPCRVTLRSGEVIDRVFVVEQAAFRRVWRASLPNEVPIADVVSIEDCAVRLPAPLANELYKAGESGMGYVLFTVRLRDGSLRPFATGNVVDFPNWPPGVDPRDVLDVEPHAGRATFRDRPPGPHERSADYSWCLYSA